jgi:DNA polymerase III subunit chi
VTDIRFYHLQRRSLDETLPQLLERVMERGSRALVMAGSEDRVEALNALLWTYSQRGFLPHGSARDGFAADQPIWLTTEDENPNDADVLILTDGASSQTIGSFATCCEVFDGNDPDAVAAARERWKVYQGQGHTLTYWQQTASGWEKKA